MFDDQQPIYRQIANQIRQDILSGQLEEEEQVMSTNQYAAFYRINPATVQKAFQQLVDEGMLYKKRGIGMFVSSGSRARLREERRASFFHQELEPVLTEARLLGISTAELLDYISDAHGKETSS